MAKIVDWDEALRWWPHSPVLADDVAQHFGRSVEYVVAGGDSGGTDGDPSREVSFLAAFYQVPGRTLREVKMFEALSHGAMGVWTTSYPPGYSKPPALSTREDAKFVTVRGRQALLFESPSQDFRQIYYIETGSGGSTLVTSFYSAPSQRAEAEAVAWADQLFEDP